MKISEIITETIDQQAANDVYFALISDGDTETARAFQRIRTNPKYNDVNSALQAAIRLAQKERNKKLSAPVQRTADTPASPQRDTATKQPAAQPPRGDYSDRFYGNQHTGSLGRKYEPGRHLPAIFIATESIGLVGVQMVHDLAHPLLGFPGLCGIIVQVSHVVAGLISLRVLAN
jgi:hypothetical protein